MATSKLLKPTNVTISIPAFTDQPDQRVNSNCIDKEADAINSLSDHIGNLLTTQEITLSSVTVNSLKTHAEWFTPTTGYTPIGVYLYATSGVNFQTSIVTNGTNWLALFTNVYTSDSILAGKAIVILAKTTDL